MPCCSVFKYLEVCVKLHLLLLSDSGECIEGDIDEIANAVVVDDGVGRRDLCNFSGNESVHVAHYKIKLQR